MNAEYRGNVAARYKELSKEDQKDLYAQMKNGDANARESIIYSCLPLVMDIAKRFRFNNKHIDMEDMIQEGNIALMKAVDRWDIEKGHITTVATWYVRNALIDLITDAKYLIRYPYDTSRRAGEDLRKVKNADSSDIDHVSKTTKLSEKRVKRLLDVSPWGSKRVPMDFQYDEVTTLAVGSEGACLADLITLVNIHLEGEQKEIFSLWAGISQKRIGPKEISLSLNKSEKYVYDTIVGAKRILSNAAKTKVQINA